MLVGMILVLALESRPRAPAPALLVGAEAGGASFPRGFGRLDELVPFAGGVNPVAEGVVPVEHAPEFRSSEWVAAQNPEAWTIQVMAAREEDAVKRFLSEREDRVDFSYFLFPQDGSYWYVVTVGSFPSRELAEGIAASKGVGAGQGQGFARRLGTYQEALRAAGAAAPAAEAPGEAPPPTPNLTPMPAPAPALPPP